MSEMSLAKRIFFVCLWSSLNNFNFTTFLEWVCLDNLLRDWKKRLGRKIGQGKSVDLEIILTAE